MNDAEIARRVKRENLVDKITHQREVVAVAQEELARAYAKLTIALTLRNELNAELEALDLGRIS